MKFFWNFGRKKEQTKPEPSNPVTEGFRTMGIIAHPIPKPDDSDAEPDVPADTQTPEEKRETRAGNFIVLEDISIAAPCHANWGAMQGDDRSRFCAQCQQEVHNLSGLTRRQAEQLVNDKQGHLCALFYRDIDGTIIFTD